MFQSRWQLIVLILSMSFMLVISGVQSKGADTCNRQNATASFNVGVKSMSSGNFEVAISSFSAAKQCFINLNCCDSLVLLSMIGSGMSEVKLGRYTGAIMSYASAEKQFGQVKGFPELEKARLLNNMSLVYRRLLDNARAITYLKRSLELKEKFNPAGADLATGWNNLAQLLEAEGNFDSALNYYTMAEGRFRQLNDNQHLLQLLSNKGMLLDRLGKTAEAVVCLEYAVELADKSKSEDNALHESLLTNLGRLYYSDENYRKSIGYYENALKFCTTNRGRISILTGLAMAYEKSNNSISADSSFRLLIECRESENGVPSEISANSLMVYGISMLKRDISSVNGFKLLIKAKDEFRLLHGNKHFSVANAWLHLADACLNNGKVEDAIRNCDNGLQALSVEVPENINHVPDYELCKHVSPLVIDLLELKAVALNRLAAHSDSEIAEKEAALNYYSLTIKLMQYYRKGMSAKSNLRWSKMFSSVYENAIILAASLHELTHDSKYTEIEFNLIESSKANILRARIEQSNALSYSGLPDTLIKDYEELQQILNTNVFQREKEILKPVPDYQRINSLDSLVSLAYFELNAQESIIASFSAVFRQWTGEYKWLNLTDLQQNISEKDYILQYFATPALVYVVVVGKQDSYLEKWAVSTNIDSVSIAYLKSIKMLEMNTYADQGRMLSALVFDPVQKYCKKGSQLIILPDTKINAIPFDLLINGYDSTEKLPIPHYLLEDYIIKYEFSATLLGSAAAFGAIHTDISTFMPDPELLNTDREANEISKSAGLSGIVCHNLLKDDATKAEFVKKLESQSVIHVSTHGYADMNNPDNSCLVFAADKEKKVKADDDSLLYAGEIYNLHSKVPLLVLNACETGRGKALTGEGNMSLARAFCIAGTQRIICTLWRVNDREAADLMKTFYSYYFSGDEPALALQKAKLHMLKQENQIFPRNWGAYIYYGP